MRSADGMQRFYSQASAEAVVRFMELVQWAWTRLRAPLVEQNAIGGPSVIALTGIIALRLFKVSNAVVISVLICRLCYRLYLQRI